MRTVAFIFARGGSKGLPGKNIKPLNGKPLLSYSIDIAKQVSEIDDIFVSTDCPEIANIASANEVKVIKRPSYLASDTSSEWLSWKHAIEYVTRKFGSFERFLSLPTTSPLRSATDVQKAIEKLENTNADICISVTPANRSPYFNMVHIQQDDSVELLMKSDDSINRRQDSPEVFDITTVVYVADVAYIKKHDSIFAGRTVAIKVPKIRALDIDDICDFMFAETMLKSEWDNAEK